MRGRAGVAMAALLAVAMTVAASACGSRVANQSGAPSTTTTTGPPAAALPGSAAAALRPFLFDAESVNRSLQFAATLVNGDIRSTPFTFRDATRSAVDMVSLEGVSRTIPAGLPPDLQLAALRVYGDLVSRRVAFNRVTGAGSSVVTRDDVAPCLANGARAAARYAGDVASLEAMAAAVPDFQAAAPDSHAAAEIALRAAVIDGWNNGCGNCGGYLPDGLATVVWAKTTDPVTGARDGTIAGVGFRATYRAGDGWHVELFAC